MKEHQVRLCVSIVSVLGVTACLIYSMSHPNLFSTRQEQRDRRNLQNEDGNKKTETDYFMKYWHLQRQMRFDFKKILKSCEHLIKWRSYYSERTPEMITSSNFSDVKLDVRPAGQYSRLFIQSYSLMNTSKNFGGDSWRVLVNGEKYIPVTTIDNLDGTYEMSFLIKDPGYYRVDLFLEYTLCDGYKDPPQRWYNTGDIQGKNQPENTLGGYEKAYLEEKYGAQDLAFFVQDSGYSVYKELQHRLKDIGHASCLMWDGFGEWNNKPPVWFPEIQEPYKRKSVRKKKNNNGIFWIYGDSVGRRFYFDTVNTSSLCRDVFRECKITVNKIYNTKPGDTPSDGKDLNLTRIEQELEAVIRNTEIFNDTDSALFVNYGLHFVMDIPFSTFIDTIEVIAKTLERYKDLYKGSIIWKTTNAMNKWKYGWPDEWKKHDRMQRFLTQPRIELFNAYSAWRLCQSDINILDILPMTSSYPFGTGTLERPYNDSVHFVRQTFMAVENYLIDYFTVGNITSV